MTKKTRVLVMVAVLVLGVAGFIGYSSYKNNGGVAKMLKL